jgi:hypothetical protein
MKARIENEQVKVYGTLPKDFKHYLNFAEADESLLKSEGFYDLITPEYKPEKQRLGDIYFDEENEIFTYPVIDLTSEELEEEMIRQIESMADSAESRIDMKLLVKLLSDKLTAATDEEAIEFKSLYKPYRVGVRVEKGDRFYYPLNDKLYQVVQGHTTQLHYKPDENITLYKEVLPPDTIGPWVQPLGAGYEYHMGDKVTHKGSTWESTINNNVWEPGVYGWMKV